METGSFCRGRTLKELAHPNLTDDTPCSIYLWMDNSGMAYVGKANNGTNRRNKQHKTRGKTPFDKELKTNLTKKGWKSITVATYNKPVLFSFLLVFNFFRIQLSWIDLK